MDISRVLVTTEMIRLLKERGITYNTIERQEAQVKKPKSTVRMMFEGGYGYFI